MSAQPDEPDLFLAHSGAVADDADLVARNDDLEQENSALRDAGSALADANTELRRQVSGLSEALTSNRTIGAAVGIVMERLHLTQDEAFAFLVRTSQNLNVKLSEVADRIIHTGELTPEG